MKLRILATFLFIAFLAIAQTTTTPTPATTAPATGCVSSPTVTCNLIAGGVSFQPGASPSTAGTGIYARLITPSTWAFTITDALPLTKSPFTVSLDSSVGIAYSPFSVGKARVFIPTAAGVTFTGPNTGWNWSTGVGVLIPVQAQSKFYVMPAVRILKSSVVNGNVQGYGFIVGAYMAWGF